MAQHIQVATTVVHAGALLSPTSGGQLASYTPALGNTRTYHCRLFSNGAQVGNSAPIYPIGMNGDNHQVVFPCFVMPSGQNYILRVYADCDDTTVITETVYPYSASADSFVGFTDSGFVSRVANVWSAAAPLASGWAFGLVNAPSSGTTAYAGLWNVTTSAYQGALVALTGVTGLLPDLTPSAAGTYAIRLCLDGAGLTLLATSPDITVAADAGAVAAGAVLADFQAAGTAARRLLYPAPARSSRPELPSTHAGHGWRE